MVFIGFEQLFFISIAALFALTTLLFACVCWQKSAQKDDLLGLDGSVKITNPDENVNHMPTLTNCVSVTIQSSVSLNSESRSDISIKRVRPSGGNNSNRSLPAIPRPPDLGNDIDDTNSDIYAQPITQNYEGSETLNSEAARPSLSQQSSLSQADGPYSRLKTEHPYDKLKKAEHPYANIQTLEDSSDREESSNVTNTNSVEASTSVVPRAGPSIEGPVAPPRSRRTSSHCSLPATSTSDIPAAVAVAGRIAASQDLPYMTPPPLQQNFSGDSQDSSKGYTSISVREPLANILLQTSMITHRITRRQELTDHYAVVSDDSDEMYAAIEDPTQLYTSGSDTYAQIQPAGASNVEPKVPSVAGSSGSDTVDALKSPAPQPPSVDSLRQVAQVHSRQASSSSCTSSVANLGSPKPEKRQANSPLPPRPPVSPEPRSGASIMRNLEDMYAKVQKNSKKKRDQGDDLERRLSGLEQSRRSSVQNTSYENGSRNRPSLDAAFGRKSWSSRESVDHSSLFQRTEHRELNSNTENSDSQIITEHCYETLKNKRKSSKDQEEERKLSSGQIYENSGPDSLLSNDPGYEVLHKNSNNPPSDCDPNYEVLKPTTSDFSQLKRKSSSNSSKPLYSTINKVRPDPGYESVKLPEHLIDEPNYESMPSDESNYASVAGGRSRAESDIDPNYEVVHRNDPNYESVKYYKRKDPPYERLHDDDSSNANLSSEQDDSSKNGRQNLSTDSDDTSGDLISDNIANRNVPDLISSGTSQRFTSQKVPNSCTLPGRRGSGIIEETIYKI